ILKWTGISLGSLIGLIVGFIIVCYFISQSKLGKVYKVKAESISFSTAPMTLERGKHLVTAVGKCSECHGEDLAGHVHFEMAGFGKVIAPNITPAGVVKNYSDLDWERAVRHGVDPKGRGLAFMPAQAF